MLLRKGVRDRETKKAGERKRDSERESRENRVEEEEKERNVQCKMKAQH